LSPHATRVNTTDAVRKAYIVQYCHADAVGYLGDGTGGRGEPIPQDDADRQLPLLVGGAAVPSAGTGPTDPSPSTGLAPDFGALAPKSGARTNRRL
ncbi:MAG: hypothetical protein KDB10_19350, partial [Acidimicrobiales bacterium]|nr:hypothetical protein [Acidimicrobiales bacterium]